MKQVAQFSYDEFWKLYESNDRPDPAVVDNDGWTDSVELDSPAPPWVRISSRRDPFPPCLELSRWPSNYPVGELADLSEEEQRETDPDRFVFSDGEMEAWALIVSAELDELVGPRLPHRASSRKTEEEAAIKQTQEVQKMEERKENNTKNKNARPVKKFEAGGVKIAIWANHGPKGGIFYSAKLERNYCRADGSWDVSPSYRANDIPRAITVLQKAYEYMVLSEAGGGAKSRVETTRSDARGESAEMVSEAVSKVTGQTEGPGAVPGKSG